MSEHADDPFVEEDFESPIENPDLAAAAAAFASEREEPQIEEPLDGPVNLPGGFFRMSVGEDSTSREEVRTAWVRELNGEDEERIAKAKLRDNLEGFVQAILEAGVDRLGDKTPTKDDLNSLTMGDRDYLLLEIARATFGDGLEYTGLPCQWCGEKMDIEVHLGEDIPVKRLDKVAETSFEIELPKNRVAVVNLPDVAVAALVAEAETPAQANTILVQYCVEEIRGPKGFSINGDADAARRLGIKDRQTLVDAMGERMPGPQYNEVRFVHEDGKCDKEVRLAVTLADLFRGM